MEIILPLLYELDPSISETVLKSRLSEMIGRGYECVGIYYKNELIGLCGIWTLIKYYVGRHIEPDNVYIRVEHRSLGIGNQLNDWLKNFALSRGCQAIELNCYVNNENGNSFWKSNEYIAIGLHYQKKLGVKK